jgi:putative transposase
MKRKHDLYPGGIYHVFTKSIAGYTVFNRAEDFLRVKNAFCYYRITDPPRKLSHSLRLNDVDPENFRQEILRLSSQQKRIVQIIAYCIMPTHLHLILKQNEENGIVVFMGNVLNSYSRYFNTLHDRKGPLWEGRFKNVPVENDEQLLHLTRYIHLNPVTAFLTQKPEQWAASSYLEYTRGMGEEERLSEFDDILDIHPDSYKEFVEKQIEDQRELAKIKELMLD